MKPVRLRRLLALEASVKVPDGAGGFTQVWAEMGKVWAEVQPASGRDQGVEEVVLSTMTYRITVRAAPPSSDRRPVPGQRFRDGTRRFAILAVTERDDSGLYLTCFVREEDPV
jgi:head-tail adaptor